MQTASTALRLHRRLMRLVAALAFAAVLPAQALTVQLLGTSPASAEFEQALREALGGAHRVVSGGAEADIVLVLHEGALAGSRQQARPRLLLLPAPGVVALQPDESALYWAPALADQVRLAMRLLPGVRRIGLLVAEPEAARAAMLRQAVAGQRVELVVQAAEPERLVPQVAELAAQTDVLVAPVDARLYHRDTLKPVLMAAYRQGRPLIGPSPAWVRGGAIASLYATPRTLAADAAAAIRARHETGRWPPPAAASRFDVITNPQVARALGLRLPDAASLSRTPESGKGSPWP